MRVVLLAAALAAVPALCAAQTDDLDPTITDGGVVTDRTPAAAAGSGGVTPDIAATVRGQRLTFTKPLTPTGPVQPQGPRRPVSLSAPSAGIGAPAGPAGPQGLPR